LLLSVFALKWTTADQMPKICHNSILDFLFLLSYAYLFCCMLLCAYLEICVLAKDPEARGKFWCSEGFIPRIVSNALTAIVGQQNAPFGYVVLPQLVFHTYVLWASESSQENAKVM